MTTILGIETSCDETAAAIVVDGTSVRSNVIASQIEAHRKYGGVVPEIASRAHIEALDTVLEEALTLASCNIQDIDAVAVTNRPGLVGALLIGLTAAKTLAWTLNKPLVTVDHIEAHALSPSIGIETPPWPAVALIVSGGHTSLYRIDGPRSISRIGKTIDDAAGEAFDKVAATLELPYPGGPEIERLSKEGNPKEIAFPRTMLGADSLDFSFSGIKTAVLYEVHGHGKTSGGLETMTPARLANIAASFQQAVIDVLISKTMRAIKQTGLDTVVLGGGVAANSTLREALRARCEKSGLGFHAAERAYCTDNAAMIAALGFHRLSAGEFASLDVDAQPRPTH